MTRADPTAADPWGEPVRWFVQRIERHFKPGHRAGVVQFAVEGVSPPIFHAQIGDGIVFYPEPHPAPCASIGLTATALRQMRESENGAWTEGNWVLSGDRGLLSLVALAAEGEQAAGLARLARLEATVRAQVPFEPTLQRRTSIGAGDLLRALRAGRPLVLEGLLTQGAWRSSLEELDAQFGHLALVGLDADILGASLDITTVGSLIRGALREDSSAVYSGGCALPGPMHDAFALPLLKPACFTRPQLWMGRRDHAACTRLHRDFLHAFIGQVHGVKSFTLYAPDEAPLLYPGACFNMFQLALYDTFAPDEVRFPLARQAHAIELDLHPGQLLVLPAGWFHAVKSKGAVMSVNRFMQEEAWDTLSRRLDDP